ncbi:AhpC/TSA family protein [Flavihumibacter sp. RY-1]|uniref:AhpC/TSA family protein n=1 Tax=Flavihumibacter fluminis TaxID=2909236 RepID=A0ABS9BIC3_9BACT|nr:TlpA disulfide reductase family protein [Flavihumibacter fluminis]MCF1714401.1 AhpC/TSA family protein [Flavihumibacter fluminis]
MNKRLLWLLLSLAISYIPSYAQPKQNTYTLTGEIIGRDTGIIILWLPDTTGIWRKDTTLLNKGKFQFSGYINEPSFAHLIGIPRKNNYSDFYLEAGKQHILLQQDNFSSFKMTGSASQQEADSLYALINPIEKNQNLPDASKQQAIIESKIQFIKEHPSSYVSPTELLGLLNNLPASVANELFLSLDEKIKESRAGNLCRDEIKKKNSLTIGSPAPDFQSFDSNKKQLSLIDYRGKYVLLDFWASWCVPCIESTKTVKQVFSLYHHRGLEVIAIADDDRSKEAWRKAIIRDNSTEFIHVLNGNSINDKYDIFALPTKYLINPEGRIIGIYIGTNGDIDLQNKLKELF